MKRAVLIVLFLLLAAPAWAQIRPGAFTVVTTTDTSANSLLVGCTVGSTTCTGGIKAGPVASSTLTTTGAATVGNALTVSAGGASITGTVGITGDTTVIGGLGVTGSLTVVSGASVGTSLSVGTTLTVTGVITGSSQINAGAGMNVSGGMTIANTGLAITSGNLTMSNGTLSVTQNASGLFGGAIANTHATGHGLYVRGGAGSNYALLVQNYNASASLLTLSGAGNMTVAGELHALDQLNVDSTMNVAGGFSFDSGGAIAGALGIGSDLAVTGVTDIRAGLTNYAQTAVQASTTPATIWAGSLVNGAPVGGMVLVMGVGNGTPGASFIDWVLVSTDGTATLIAGHSSTGGVPGRTYSFSGTNLQVTLASDFYKITVMPLTVGTPGG